MSYLVISILVVHLTLAAALFFFVNWIGKHAVEFGYTSMTLFEEVNESAALNFFLRAVSPSVFIIAVSAVAVAIDHPEWRLGIYWVAIYYYAARIVAIFLLGRQHLVSWPKFLLHATSGVVIALLAYQYLIVPNRSLLPNIEQMGNELWLAILAFLYAVANKVPVTSGPGARRRNKFVELHYADARSKFNNIITAKTSDDTLELIVFSVLIYEDYARPEGVRALERIMFWKKDRTTGIMQVTADRPLSDTESVRLGAAILASYWSAFANEEYMYSRVRSTIAAYNPDNDYVSRVFDVMEILSMRVERKYTHIYNSINLGKNPDYNGGDPSNFQNNEHLTLPTT
ncbi:hypothetical protein [Devosia sp. 2618]|uniref:hypothetical protein n=1 Tax=Devosia sp. 2618 TaxID=3156454 RepID=UPI0033999857